MMLYFGLVILCNGVQETVSATTSTSSYVYAPSKAHRKDRLVAFSRL